jgi:anti-sigma B factor antagonist
MRDRSPVVIMEVPTLLNDMHGNAFLQELEPLLESERPYIVLDCSQLQHVDSAGIEVLLRCMEEAMKRNGDVKLAGVSPACAAILELMRVDRVFETFDTAEEGVRSFQAPASIDAAVTLPWYSDTSILGGLKAVS